MSNVRCPRCGGTNTAMKAPDYGYGTGAVYCCGNCNRPYGYQFCTSSPEALSESDAARGQSRRSAEEIRSRARYQ